MAAPPIASQENGGTDWVMSSPRPENNPSASTTTAASIGLLINSANPRVISWTANPPIEASRANQVSESPTHCEIGNTSQSGIVDNQLGPRLVARTNAITATAYLTEELAKRGRLSNGRQYHCRPFFIKNTNYPAQVVQGFQTSLLFFSHSVATSSSDRPFRSISTNIVLIVALSIL